MKIRLIGVLVSLWCFVCGAAAPVRMTPVKVTEGGTDGDVTIRTSEETFRAIASREQNPTTAYMTGKLKIDGDMGAAMKLQKLF